jgi:gluconokinase
MIVLVGGVAGCGKTTIGAALAARLRWVYADADDFHSPANIAKMRENIPLTDADRKPWLAAIEAWMDERIATGTNAVVGCSALKQRYRDELLNGRPEARMVFLEISRDLAQRRLVERHGHFFTVNLMDDQFEELEEPTESEQLIVVSAAETPDRIVTEIVDRLGLVTNPPRPGGR